MTEPEETAIDLSTAAGAWSLDPHETSVVFHTKAMWVFNVKGTFKAIEGTGFVDAGGAVSGSIILDAASVNTKNKKRDDHLRTADFFEVQTYPTLAFTLKDARLPEAGTAEVIGDLMVRDATRQIPLLVSVHVDGNSATITAEGDIDRSAWGMSWTKMGAGLKNHVVINARFKKA